MEIAVHVQSVSFYHQSRALYSTVEVFEKKIITDDHNLTSYFHTVEQQQRIQLIYKGPEVLDFLQKLSKRVVRVKVSGIDLSKDPNKQGFKFVIESIKQCALLQVISIKL